MKARQLPFRLNNYTAIEDIGRTERGWRIFKCICDCGTEFVVDSRGMYKKPYCDKCIEKNKYVWRTPEKKLQRRRDKWIGVEKSGYIVTDVLKSESVYYNIEVTCIHCNDKIIINSTYFNNKGIRKCPCTTIKEREESHRKKKEAQIANSIRKKEEHKKKLQEAREKGVLLRFKDLTGQRFGMLYVIKHEGFTSSPNGKIHPTFLCKCLCGNRKVIKGSNLTQLGKYNCGCITAKQNKLKAINTNKKLKEKRDRLIELGLATPKIPRDRHSKRSMKLSTTIRYKYNNTCQKCHQYFPKGECDAHHAIPFAKSEKYRFMTSNCVLLCKKCHRQFHAKYGYFEFVPKDTIEYLFGR